MKFHRSQSSLTIRYTFYPWYKRLWYWLTRKKLTTAGNGDYVIDIPSEWEVRDHD